MIKLVVSDLDGTLLLPSKRLPTQTFALIEALYQRGILFAPASGRQLPNLQKLFAPVLDKIAIIAENGGLVWHQGRIIYANPTPLADVRRALNVVKKEPDLYPLCSCDDCAYYESDDTTFIETVNRSYSSAVKVDDLSEAIEGKTVLKISVWDPLVAAKHGGITLPPKLPNLRTMVSGYDWLDICVQGANKGEALKALLRHLALKKEQCMAFGDHMNDFEMLQESGQPYVTANAYAGLKEHFPQEVASCADEGVIEKCKELL
jgi:hypothetical protein